MKREGGGLQGHEEPETHGFGMRRTEPVQRVASRGGTFPAIGRGAALLSAFLSAFVLSGPPVQA